MSAASASVSQRRLSFNDRNAYVTITSRECDTVNITKKIYDSRDLRAKSANRLRYASDPTSEKTETNLSHTPFFG